MNQELAHKRPAQVVARRPMPKPTTRRVIMLAERSRARLMDALRRRHLAGELERTSGDIELLTHGQYAGYYAVRVVLVPPRKVKQRWPMWAKVCIGLGTTLAVLAGALAWLIQSLSREALVAFLLAALIGFVAWVRYRYFGGGGGSAPRGVEVDVAVSVRVR